MFLLLTWTLFWKGYGLAVICLVSVPVGQGFRDGREDPPGRMKVVPIAVGRKEESVRLMTDEGTGLGETCFRSFLQVWEPETPPIIKAAPIQTIVEEEDPTKTLAAEKAGPPGSVVDGKKKSRTAGASLRKRRKHGKGKNRRKKRALVSPAYYERINRQNRMFRKGLRQVAREMLLCIHEVADFKITEREMRQALRFVIQQHPGLKELPYPQAVQELLWLEDSAGTVSAREEPEEWQCGQDDVSESLL